MGYDYKTLEKYRGNQVGKWCGIPVLSISKEDYERQNYVQGFYLVIYDDHNALVKNNMVVGKLSQNGEIIQITATPYSVPKKKETPVEIKVEEVSVEARTIPLVDAGSNEFFERVGREIEEILKKQNAGIEEVLKKSDFKLEG